MRRRGTQFRRLVGLLLGVNLLLGGLVALEIRNPDRFVWQTAIVAGNIIPADSGTTPAAARLAPVVSGEAAFAAITARPLFSPDRRPVGGPGDGATGSVSSDLSGYVVTGIATSGTGGIAILEKTGRAAGPEPGLVVGPGDTVEGWSVDEIRNDRIVVKKDGELQELMLRKDKPSRTRIPRVGAPGVPQPRRLLPQAPQQPQPPRQSQQPQQPQPGQ